MTLNEIADLRLSAQQIHYGRYRTGRELTAWMGAMQAQDFNMVRWAIGLRIPGSTLTSVEDAINNGDIIRTHLLRPTWHFVSVDDLRWMLELTGPRIRNGLKYRHNSLGLPLSVLSEMNTMIAGMLKGKQLERDELRAAILKKGIRPGDNSTSHVLLWAELSGIICSGKIVNNRQTYALLDDRIPAGKNFQNEEMAAMLAKRYFKSHGPATIQDFSWWSGLTRKEILQAIEMSYDELEAAEAGPVKYWYGKDLQHAESRNTAVLMPAFDEFIIGYADRSAVITDANHRKAVSQNGIFRSVVLLGNHVGGLWSQLKGKDRLIIEVNPFRSLKKAEKSSVEAAAEDYGRFMEKKIEVKYSGSA